MTTTSSSPRLRLSGFWKIAAAAVTAACVPPISADAPGGRTGDNDLLSSAVEINPPNKLLYNFDTTVNNANPSVARGLPTAGSILNAINLPDNQAGYNHHYGSDATDTDDWAALGLINRVEQVAIDWRDVRRPCINPNQNPNPPPRFGVGDMSKGNVSTRIFGGFWSDHPLSHQNGLDVDLRFLRTDHALDAVDLEGPSAIYYDAGATADLMGCFLYYPNVVLLVVDTVYAGIDFLGDPRIQHKTDHRDHWHVRIVDPDGLSN